LDVQPISQATTKVHVLYVLLVNKRRDMVVLNVKIVVPGAMAMVASYAIQVNIASRRLTFQRPVVTVVLDDTNQTLDKQAAFRARLENINILKEKKHVHCAKLDVQAISQGMIKVHVHCVLLVKRIHDPALRSV
jgi:hypothetical protein